MTERIVPTSTSAMAAGERILALQGLFVRGLEDLSIAPDGFRETSWLRDEGRHGGGNRFGVQDSQGLDRASINVSQVHYDDDPTKKLASATALSCIVHPKQPRAASVHLHISWTKLRNGAGTWRMMADLNPAIPDRAQTEAFRNALQSVSPELYEGASAQGDRYFWIPALGRHRGVSHYYLEGYSTGDFAADLDFAERFGRAAITIYLRLLEERLDQSSSAADRQTQLAYHSLYLFQVLTLDRGTSSGLLVHDQNDVGILGSIPGHVDRDLLASWRPLLPKLQAPLLDRILHALPQGSPSPITDDVKRALAQAVREHYREFPEALALQASGDVLPPTVENHR